jgi:hypothetical protein
VRMNEHDVQKQIVDALVLAGFDVQETTAYKQKGESGTDKGIADLLVSHRVLHYTCLCLEVKAPGKIKWSSLEQRAAFETSKFRVVQSSAQAVEYARDWLKSFLRYPFSVVSTSHVWDAVERAERTLEALK